MEHNKLEVIKTSTDEVFFYGYFVLSAFHPLEDFFDGEKSLKNF